MLAPYIIRKREGQWHLLTNGRDHAIFKLNDRDSLVRLALPIASKHDGSIEIYNESGQIDAIIRFHNGAMTF